ncbi:MAG: NADH:ubiquinone oxidoreductase [Proteobacteria bacterium]|nr:NADH:ubiquinone oxidoreductase [Pseudomonadota bacterium]MBU1687195.1 NADH:ubiquinone oxidoreductase [Pseudomonadota bacterium]
MSDKPKIAMYWASSCGGCEIALVNLHEKILDVDAAFNLFFCPCLVDTKTKDIEALADGELAITFFNGAIRTDENLEMARLLRKKSQILIAFGSCAVEGCIPALGNLVPAAKYFDPIYRDNLTTANPDNIIPLNKSEIAEGSLGIPLFLKKVRTLGQVTEVDYFLPGCPPEPHRIWQAVAALIAPDGPPPKGSVVGVGPSTVCAECRRERTDKKIRRFFRTYEIIPNQTECLLDQGILCMGIATREGCGGLCPEVNMPCTGCYGPPAGRLDQGARMTAAIGSILDLGEVKGLGEKELHGRIDQALGAIPDYAGTFYKYSLAGSILGGREKL